jgi:hypothetical protein
MVKSERTFLPAAGHDVFLPMYDTFTKVLGFDRTRVRLLDQPDGRLELVDSAGRLTATHRMDDRPRVPGQRPSRLASHLGRP